MEGLRGDDIIKVLLDENNSSNVKLKDLDNNDVEFEQMMTIPYYDEYRDTTDTYCILHPVKNSKYFSKNMVYSFGIYKNGNEYILEPVEDEDVLFYLEREYNKN